MRALTIELSDSELAALEVRARRENTSLEDLSRVILVGLMTDDANWSAALAALAGSGDRESAGRELLAVMKESQRAVAAAGLPESVVAEAIAEVRASRR